MFPPLLATVLLDPPVALAFGCLLALASARLIALAPEREVFRTAVWGGAFGLVYGLLVAWFYFTYPDWMLVYLRDTRGAALWPSYLVFLVIIAGHGFLGGLAASLALTHGRRGLAYLALAVGLGTYAGAMWLQWPQYLALGTYAEYMAGQATTPAEDLRWQRAANLVVLAGGVVAAGMVAIRYLQGRRLPRPSATG